MGQKREEEAPATTGAPVQEESHGEAGQPTEAEVHAAQVAAMRGDEMH